MISAEDIEKYLVEGHVEYIRRATLVASPYNKGYYIGTSAHIHNFFIRDEGTVAYPFHSGSRVFKPNHPYHNMVLYVLPHYVKFKPLGIKV